MKSYEAFNAYQTVKKMADYLNVPFKTRLELVYAKRTLEDVAIAYAHAEKAVAEKYADRDDNGAIKIIDGYINFTDIEKKESAFREIAELRSEEVLADFRKVKINTSWCDQFNLTSAEIESLMHVVDFMTGGEENGTI